MDFVKLDDLVSSSLNNDRFKTLALLKEMDQGLLRCYEQEVSEFYLFLIIITRNRNSKLINNSINNKYYL